MKYKFLAIIIILFSAFGGCITEFIPETEEASNLLVVEGMITDQNRKYKIKVSRALPLGKFVSPKPVKGCQVTIIDENNISYLLKESPIGTYTTDSTKFRGYIGGKYTLKIVTGNLTYMSSQMELLPVPPIDSLFYEKEMLVESNEYGNPEEGCTIYLNTFDSDRICLFYRWEFIETWMFKIPFAVPNSTCWITRPSEKIMIRNTSVYDQARITRYPVHQVSNKTDRLKEKYSIVVKQYSINQDEYGYWEKLQNVYENVGGLYDVTPMTIPSNIRCMNKPDEIVLGYFSVSAIAEKRIFIKEKFEGMPSLYNQCICDTVPGGAWVPIEGLNIYKWVIIDNTGDISNPYRVLTCSRECADCTTRGSNVQPSFWED